MEKTEYKIIDEKTVTITRLLKSNPFKDDILFVSKWFDKWTVDSEVIARQSGFNPFTGNEWSVNGHRVDCKTEHEINEHIRKAP